MMGRMPLAFAAASRASNSATVAGGWVMPTWRGQLLVVEDAGEAVVETHRVQRAGAAGAIGGDPVLASWAAGHLSQPNAAA